MENKETDQLLGNEPISSIRFEIRQLAKDYLTKGKLYRAMYLACRDGAETADLLLSSEKTIDTERLVVSTHTNIAGIALWYIETREEAPDFISTAYEHAIQAKAAWQSSGIFKDKQKFYAWASMYLGLLIDNKSVPEKEIANVYGDALYFAISARGFYGPGVINTARDYIFRG